MKMTAKQKIVFETCKAHPDLNSAQIAEICGENQRYCQKLLRRFGFAKPVGAPQGNRNPSWKGGRMVDSDGYVMLQTKPTRVSEHRQVMAEVLGRPLTQSEVVDHIDGITIHNHPSNLRLFATNGEHLAETSRNPRKWSASGLANIGARTDLGSKIQRVDTYRLRKERGDVRLRAILRASLELGIDHPCLSGTQHWLVDIGIDPKCYRSLERAWAELCQRYEADLSL